MRRTLLVTLALLFLIAPAEGVAQQPEKRIAAGVSAGGIDVSGLTLTEATNRLAFAHITPLSRPLATYSAGRRFPLRPAEVDFVFDPAKSARRAYIAGNAKRTAPVDVPLYVMFRRSKINAYAEKVENAIDRVPRDARVDIGLRRIGTIASRDGRTLNTKMLADAVAAALADPAAERKLRAKVVPIKPRVTTAGLASAYGTILTIDRGNTTLRLFKRLKLSKTYRVAVGQSAYPTPTGRFSIVNKAVNPAWTAPDSPWAGAYRNEVVPGGSAENPLKARWMGIVNGVGIHGTGIPGSIGTWASHGCIRMTVPDVIDLYPRVPVGTPVLIGN